MSPKIELGKQGEMHASYYLKKLGYQFVGANVRCGKSEIDLIFKDGEILVFIEVKTRKDAVLQAPEESVDLKKQKSMIAGAEKYLEEFSIQNDIRFDIVSIIIEQGRIRIKHFKDAFWPGYEHN